MEIIKIFSLLAISAFSVSCEDVISGLVKIATCRATCNPRDTLCWDTCLQLSTSKDTAFCQRDTCGHVCQSVCRHYMLSNTTPDSKRVTKNQNTYQFTRMPKLLGCSLAWAPLEVASNTMVKDDLSMSIHEEDHHRIGSVYLVLGQDRAGQWYEVTQTISTYTSLPAIMSSKLARIVILGVRDDGVHDSVIMETDGVDCELEERRTQVEQVKDIEDPTLKPVITSMKHIEGTFLTEVSLTWSGVVDDSPRYMVQWQKVPKGIDIVGNLVTAETGVSLTLETDSIFVVTVKDIASRRASSPRIIMTSTSSLSSSSTSSSRISLELIILIVLTIATFTTFVGICLHRRLTQLKTEEYVNKFNEEIELRKDEYIAVVQCLKANEENEEKLTIWNKIAVFVSSFLQNAKIYFRGNCDEHATITNV